MKRTLIVGSLLVLATVSKAIPQTRTAASAAPSAQAGSAPATPVGSSEQARTMVNTYCTGCHSTAAKMGGLALDGLNLDAVANDAPTWEKVSRKLRGRLMPPPGAKQ